MELGERARAYVRSMEGTVSGSGGCHIALFKAAVALVCGFELSDSDALAILEQEYNPRCSPVWSDSELTHKVKQARAVGQPPVGKQMGWLRGSEVLGKDGVGAGSGVAPTPGMARQERKPFDPAKLRKIFRSDACRPEWFMEKSPIAVSDISPRDFLTCMYRPEDRVLIFTEFKSQGDFLWWKGQTYRLGQRPDVKAVPSELPKGGPDGMWYLAAPVTGLWKPNADGNLSRRSSGTVTRWPYLILENDPPKNENPAEMRELWLSFLAQLPLPIAAIYESGGKSIHALVRLGGDLTEERFNAYKRYVGAMLAVFGPDPKAIRPLQLTRLPGAYRGKNLQRLLYLNPTPDPAGLALVDGGYV